MAELLVGGGLAAAFLAGIVALLAPCCITVLLPAYLGAAVRNRRWRLVPLTGVFAAGLAFVLVPITLGVGLLTDALMRYHEWVYAAGGILLLVFAGVIVAGGAWTLPLLRGAPDVRRSDAGGVFALGVFSGAASACCAPVLAGVVALAGVAPGVGWSVAFGLAYTLGMVAPLLVAAALYDRLGAPDLRRLRGRVVRYRLAGREREAGTVDLVVAGLFTLTGVGLLAAAATGTTLAPSGQTRLGLWLTEASTGLASWLAPVPDAVVGLGLVVLAAAAVALAGRRRPPTAGDGETTSPNRGDAGIPATPRADDDPTTYQPTTGTCHDHDRDPEADEAPHPRGRER